MLKNKWLKLTEETKKNKKKVGKNTLEPKMVVFDEKTGDSPDWKTKALWSLMIGYFSVISLD